MTRTESPDELRSRSWLDDPELYGWLRRAALRSQGFSKSSLKDRPLIGICNSWSELTHCNAHLKILAESVKTGVIAAGGIPLEFPVMSLGEYNMRPTTMLYRNLMSMDVEESIRANPVDGVVLLAGCDKTTPAMLMGALSANVPSIMLTGGSQLKAKWRGEELGTCTDCRRYQQELGAGRISPQDWEDLQGSIIQSSGHCGVMGTASTMAAVCEVLGVALPGNTDIPASDPARSKLAEASGYSIVSLAKAGRKPTDFLTKSSIHNSIRTIHALGGSTNAVIHLIAIAGRAGFDLQLKTFDRLSKTTPYILDLKPSGSFLMEDFYHAGGLSALLKEMKPLLTTETPNVNGKTLGDNINKATNKNPEVIRTLLNPIESEGGLAVLQGSLSPTGAVIKQTAASPDLLHHIGKAVVFDNHDHLNQDINSPNLDINAKDILIMRNSGPVGGPGMPEWGLLPIPKQLLEKGVRDMVRISDARMSGTAFGTVVVHVTPESNIGGPLATVQSGDVIELDVKNRKLDLLVEEQEIKRRYEKLPKPSESFDRGYGWLYSKHALQADKGCDFDFLRSRNITESI